MKIHNLCLQNKTEMHPARNVAASDKDPNHPQSQNDPDWLRLPIFDSSTVRLAKVES